MTDSDVIVSQQGVSNVDIISEMRRSYLNYSMSVIVARALPDIRDGLKPVHRRILYAMHKMGLHSTAKYSKSAKVVGEVLGKYHPHGDSAVYEAMVRLAQEFSLRYPLIKGQGNFGSIDGDEAAAMRYTEAKLSKISNEMLEDIEKETVPFRDNFDGSLQEPDFLPAKLPNLLLMGAEGIAVGMATKIPPHNLTEIVDALTFMIDNTELSLSDNQENGDVKNAVNEKAQTAKDCLPHILFHATVDDLMNYIKGPDFPTYGTIYGNKDIKEAYTNGRGKILIRGELQEEQVGKGKSAIIVTEIPYQVNKANLVEKIARLVIEKKIIGISDIRDESNREGIRIVIELKRDTTSKKVINNLFKFTDLQTSFPVNVVTLVDGVPQTLGIKPILEHYLRHRANVVINRSEFELKQAKHRAHILEGLLIALDNIDEVINIIRNSPDESTAKQSLMSSFGLTDIQSQAILDMQLKRLTGLERSKIEDELQKLRERIDYLESILKDIFKILAIIKEEILELKKVYGDNRRTRVVPHRPGEISDEQLIENKEVLVVLTKEGYIKQMPMETFKVQNRGGKGVAGIVTKESDNIFSVVSTKTHNYIMFFTNQGRVFQNRVWEVPQGTRTSRGKAIVNMLSMKPGEQVTSVLTYTTVDDFPDTTNIVMVTKMGTIKKTQFKDFANIKSNGIIAIRLDKGDELFLTKMTSGKDTITLTSMKGKTIMFNEQEVKSTGRSSKGVRGIDLAKGDKLTSADIFTDWSEEKKVLIITEKGIGKMCSLSLFKDQHRGGKGVKIVPISKQTGDLVFASVVNGDYDGVMMTSRLGQVVKIGLKDIPSYSREAKGVILMRFSNKEDTLVHATLM